MNLFVLVSTGQRVANLPPVLELAEQGDQVLWIESDEARQRDWTTKPRQLLEKRGLATATVVRVAHVNDPALLVEKLKPTVRTLTGKFQAVYLVTNGGTKHTPIGLVHAFQHMSPLLLYGDERPAVYSVYPSGFMGKPTTRPYVHNNLDLPDLLAVNSYVYANKSLPCQIWPDELPQEIAKERYGQDEQYTYDLHAQHYEWASINKAKQRVPFKNLKTLVPDPYRRWLSTVRQVRHTFNTQDLNSLYNCTLNLSEAAAVAAARKVRQVEPPSAPIGISFERAVARRVRDWQETHCHPAVRSIWTNVKIASESAPEIVVAEFDILIVLKNGILLHLECKSSSADPRDLEVNTYRLRQAGSQLARSAVVVPIFTRCASEPWFSALHDTRTIVEAQLGEQNVLPFTFPGQPLPYQIGNTDAPKYADCQPFEHSLTAFLRPYRQ